MGVLGLFSHRGFGSKPAPEREGMGMAGMGQEGSLALTQPEGMARLLAALRQVMGLEVS